MKGSEAAAVYWRRRAIVAGVLVGMIAVVGLGFKALSGGGDPEPPAVFKQPTPTVPYKTPHIPSSAELTTSPEPEEVEPEEVASCVEDDLLLQVVAAFSEVRAGADVPVSVLVASGAEAACTAALDQVEVEVTAGEDVVFSSAHCEAARAEPVELEAGDGETLEFVFDGKASDTGCVGDRRQLPAGEYELRAVLGGAASDPAAIRLT